MIQQSHFWVNTPKNWNKISNGYLHTHVHCRIIQNIQEEGANQMTFDGWMDKQSLICI